MKILKCCYRECCCVLRVVCCVYCCFFLLLFRYFFILAGRGGEQELVRLQSMLEDERDLLSFALANIFFAYDRAQEGKVLLRWVMRRGHRRMIENMRTRFSVMTCRYRIYIYAEQIMRHACENHITFWACVSRGGGLGGGGGDVRALVACVASVWIDSVWAYVLHGSSRPSLV